MTKVALQTHKKDLMRETSNLAKKKFLYRLTRSDYEREWGKTYTRPGRGTRVLAALLRYFPKVGPFKGMGFDSPTAQIEDLYIKSINHTVDQYRAFLQQVRSDTLILPNCDFDSGKITKAAEYSLTDNTYAQLVGQLAERKFDLMTPQLRENILTFYSDLSVPIETKKDQVRWQEVLTSLEQLRSSVPTSTVAENTPR